ncbi:hypothetical protein KAZ66_04160 [Candidatus Woesebacteria bacterium]|nr:hypothetical protein [Candidatus Woesebacteria bacterium]
MSQLPDPPRMSDGIAETIFGESVAARRDKLIHPKIQQQAGVAYNQRINRQVAVFNLMESIAYLAIALGVVFCIVILPIGAAVVSIWLGKRSFSAKGCGMVGLYVVGAFFAACVAVVSGFFYFPLLLYFR